MAEENVATEVADDDFDLSAALTAEFDKAEAAEAPEPEKESGETAAERARDEKGRFAASAAEGDKGLAAQAKEPGTKESPETKPQADPSLPEQPVLSEQPVIPEDANRAPPGWSPTAKAAFAELPADHPIRLAVAQREVEINKGFAKLTEYKPIERFAEMARRGGTTLERALEAYTGIENELGQNFVGGITKICQNRGISPVALANEIIARNGGSPSNGETGTTPQAHQTAPVDPNAITQTVLNKIREEQEQREIGRLIKEFGSDPKNTFFENVRADMASLIGAGYAKDIPDAYQKACWANDEIRPLLIKQQAAPSIDLSAKAAAASQARNASKSITGSPVPGVSGSTANISLEDEIRGLMNAAV